MPYVICEPCIGVKARKCQEVCPVSCIHDKEGDEQVYINPDDCIECAACEAVCPVGAAIRDDDVPEKWRSYIEKNAAYFRK